VADAPLVSIVVPAWGAYAQRPLAEALESLRAQEAPARIVVVDNASQPPIVAADGVVLRRLDERVSLGAARNAGLADVATPYVVFWDADDLMLPGTLERLTRRIERGPDIVAVAAAILEGDPPVAHRWPRRWTRRVARRRRVFALANCVWSLFPTTGSTIMRVCAVRAVGAYGDGDSGEDWVLGASLAFRGRVVFDPAPGRLYRRHAASVWSMHSASADLVAHAAAVRARLRANFPCARWLLWWLAAAQLTAALALHPLARVLRTVRAAPHRCASDP
jgi:glycosyltransferase involved in cell wall biosynthesis